MPTDQPVLVEASISVTDVFGLASTARVVATNYWIVDAGPWVESTLGIEAASARAIRRRVERLAAQRGSVELYRSQALLEVAGDCLDLLHDRPATSGYQVGGALRLLIRIDELLDGELGLRVGGLRRSSARATAAPISTS